MRIEYGFHIGLLTSEFPVARLLWSWTPSVRQMFLLLGNASGWMNCAGSDGFRAFEMPLLALHREQHLESARQVLRQRRLKRAIVRRAQVLLVSQ
jgi:hypothetical protein